MRVQTKKRVNSVQKVGPYLNAKPRSSSVPLVEQVVMSADMKRLALDGSTSAMLRWCQAELAELDEAFRYGDETHRSCELGDVVDTLLLALTREPLIGADYYAAQRLFNPRYQTTCVSPSAKVLRVLALTEFANTCMLFRRGR